MYLTTKQITADIVRRAEQGGIKALCITVDAPQLGRREKDMRNKFSAAPPDVQKKVSLMVEFFFFFFLF